MCYNVYGKEKQNMEIQEALEIVINEAPDEYAKTYARAGLELGDSRNAVMVSDDNGFIGINHEKTGKQMIGEELRVQLLYVLSNLSSWRGEKAREVKLILKEASKRKVLK